MENAKQWDNDIILDLFNQRDANLILSIPLSQRSVSDSWFWCFDSKGLFSVKSCYKAIRGEIDVVVNPVWSRIWKLHIPNKVKHFL